MEIFFSLTGELDETRARRPGRSRARGSAFGVSLLEEAVRQVWDIPLPELAAAPGGKPYFPAYPELCFSVGHTQGAVLAALSRAPVGADVERRREIHAETVRRLMRPDCGDLTFFELWTLRESYYKLTGRGDLRAIPFSRAEGVVTPPEPDILCRVYDEIPGCAAAACSRREPPPAALRSVPAARLMA